jgi:hypothetical protein
MTEPCVPGVGAVWTADIVVTEHEREVRFSSRVPRWAIYLQGE